MENKNEKLIAEEVIDLFVEDDDLLKEDVFASKNNNKTLLKALFIRELFPFLLIIDCYIKNLSALFFYSKIEFSLSVCH